MGVLPKLFNLWPWVDLDPFYAKVKFGHIGFCMGKSENYLFFLETIAALGLKVCFFFGLYILFPILYMFFYIWYFTKSNIFLHNLLLSYL